MSQKQISVALFEPDIPQNTGSIMRLCACLGVRLHIIEPCGFLLVSKDLRRVAMDYGEQVEIIRHISWDSFTANNAEYGISRLILLTTKTQKPYTNFAFDDGDCLLLGRESSGVPDFVAEAAHDKTTIPMRGAARSLNVALACAMVLGEAIK